VETSGRASDCAGFPLKIIRAEENLSRFINPKKYSIYRRIVNGKSINRKRLAFTALSLTALALILTFSVSISKTKAKLSELNTVYSERQSRHHKAEQLLREIHELEEPPRAAPLEREGRRIPDPYAVLAESHRGTETARIHSIIIQGERFSLEAVGDDALKAVKSLAASPWFSSLTLHQSSPSDSGTERFSVSGSIIASVGNSTTDNGLGSANNE
jgi:hypothetical protein